MIIICFVLYKIFNFVQTIVRLNANLIYFCFSGNQFKKIKYLSNYFV